MCGLSAAWRRCVVLVVACCGLLWFPDGAHAQTETITVDTAYGPVMGTIIEDINNGDFTADVATFYAVKFATAERFAKPDRNLTPWTEPTVTAWNSSQACPQGGGVFDNTHPGWRDFSEDCLHSNIFVPYNSTDPGPYPVMVWFHGGAYQGGGNIMYPGHFLATRDVIVVVANYRLNDFGFAYTASDVCPGNFGLWDQNAVLHWIQENIANFNGDPNRVTMFGQSAGASSTGLQIVSPQSKDLFHQAILESGCESNFWSVNWPEQIPENYIWEMAEDVNCNQPDFTDQDLIDCLRALPWEDIHSANFRCEPGHYCLGMAPVIDGVVSDPFLPEHPLDLRASGNIMDGPIIAGLNHDDGSYYTLAMIPESALGGFTREEFQEYVCQRLVGIWEEQAEQRNDTETVTDVCESLDWNYAPWPHIDDEYVNRNQVNKMITDAAFGMPWDRLMKDHHTRQSNTYGYMYDYRGRNGVEYFPEWMGVPHEAELPQVWGWPLLPWNDQVRDDSGIYYDMVTWTDEDRMQTKFWQTLYTNFAKTGNPTPQPVQGPVGEPVTWRPFTNEDMALIYVNNVTINVQTLWRQQDYAYFREYLAYLTEGYAFPF